MIDQSKTYRTRDGREARVYATDGGGLWPVHGAVRTKDGWTPLSWKVDGEWHHADVSLIPADPHGILPRHRELLADVYKTAGHLNRAEVEGQPFNECDPWTKCALIALARLEKEKGE